MLPFFRKIRWRHARDNQFFKYSRYAVGEIVLVVIGILIALYINNWNEQRKERDEFDLTLVEVEKELIANIIECRNVLGYYQLADSIVNKILFDTLTMDDYKNVDFIQNFTFIATTDYVPSLSSVAYDKLFETIENLTADQDSVVEALKTLTSASYEFAGSKEYIKKYSDAAHKLSIENQSLYQQFPWYRDYLFNSSRNEEMLNFFVNDHRHLNAVAKFAHLVLGNLCRMIEEYEIESVASYRLVYDYLEKHDVTHVDSLHFKYDAHQFEHYLGTYKPYENTNIDLDFAYEDSVVVSLENGKLYYTPYFREGGNSKREIIPVNKYRFRTVLGRGFYHIDIDSSNIVKGITFSNGRFKVKEKKIR